MSDQFGMDNNNNGSSGESNNNAGGYDNNNMNGYNNGGYNNNNMGGYGNNTNGYNNGGYYNNNMNGGYNNNGGYYQNDQFTGIYNDSNYNMPDERKGKGLAIASFVLAIINIFPCCTSLSIIIVPLCIIFSLVSLFGKRKGTAFAVIGLILALIAGIFFAYFGYITYKIFPDFVYFADHEEQIISEYDADGTIPERFEKYRQPKYDKYWERMGYDSFDEFFAKFIEEQKRNSNYSGSSSSSDRKSGSNSDLSLGFVPALML